VVVVDGREVVQVGQDQGERGVAVVQLAVESARKLARPGWPSATGADVVAMTYIYDGYYVAVKPVIGLRLLG
jgi:hypothetical protein